MAKKVPLSAAEKAELGDFIVQLVLGKVELGYGSVGMLGLYGRAQEEGLSLIDILGESPQILTWSANLLHAHARKIPKSAIDLLRLIVKAADHPPAPVRPPTQVQTSTVDPGEDV